jgi:tRNA dimethylallyltransferase
MPSPKSSKILVLIGPTGSGKTAISLPLARILHGEIISADSRQIYRHLDIGTAKPTHSQRSAVRHHFIDEVPPDAVVTAGEFGERGRRVVAELLGEGKVPIVVGGSGLYIRSLIDGLFEGPATNAECREFLRERLETEGLESLVQELVEVDPATAAHIDRSNPRRVLRALEFYHSTGMPLSTQQRDRKVTIPFTAFQFGLEWARDVLFRRINERCDAILAGGLLDEVEQLKRLGYLSTLQALNTVGYKEAFALRSGLISYEEMVQLFKQNSRRYAKRQLTWFRRDSRIRWIPMEEPMSPEVVAEWIAREYLAAT